MIKRYMDLRETITPHVIPSKEGIHKFFKRVDSRLHGNDTHGKLFTFRVSPRYFVHALLVICFSTIASTQAYSCDADFVGGYGAPPLTVDVFGASDTTVTSTIPVAIEMNNNATCTFAITFFSDKTRNSTKRTLSDNKNSAYYTIEDGTRVLTSSISANSSNARLNFTVTDKTQTLASPQYTFRFANTDIAPMGNYTGNITATLYRISGNTRTQLDQIQYPVTAVVPNGMLISLGNLQPSGGSFAVLDLGNLYSGLQNTATISLRSNSAYKVSMASQNKSILKLEGASGSNAEIPYTARFNGKTVVLTGGTSTVLSNGAVTNAQGHSYPLVITVPDVTNKYSGQYVDQLTVTIEAR